MRPCGWTELCPYEMYKMSCKVILLCLKSVGTVYDQTVLCSQLIFFETYLCLVFRFGETEDYSGLDPTEFQ